MADQNATPDEEYNDDGSKNPDFVAPKTESESAGADTENKGIEGEEDGKKEGEGEEDFNDTIDPTKPPEIPVRQSVAQHIIARKNEKIKKLESRISEGDEGYVAPEGNDGEEEDDAPDLSPETSKAINSTVQKAIAPLLGKIASEAEEKEMRGLIASDPEAKKYVNHIKAYMSHEAYKGVPPAVIYHHLAWNAAQALGARKRKAADLEANQGKGGGRAITDKGTVGDLPSAEDIADMSDADFEKMENDARQGKFIKK